jgi:Transglycosylase SLT domain
MKIFATLLFITALCVSGRSYAGLGHAELAHSNLCIQAFTKAERQYGIPKHLLMAVANTESGRYNKAIGRVVPWPWTTNVKGAGGYHNSFADAVAVVQKAKGRGQDSIDVGCMQINLKHHPHAFNSIQDAFDPVQNVNYAAKFLRSNYDELKSWNRAIGAYHSRTPSRSNKYYALVRKRWSDIRGDVGGSQIEDTEYAYYSSNVPDVKVTHLFRNTDSTITNTGAKSVKLLPFKSFGAPEPQRAKAAHQTFKVAVTDSNNGLTSRNFAPAEPPEMKVIKVSSRSSESDGVNVVVTPLSKRTSFDAPSQNPAYNNSTIYPKTIKVPSTSLNTHQQKVIKVTNNHGVEQSAVAQNPQPVRRGPNFIFNQ